MRCHHHHHSEEGQTASLHLFFRFCCEPTELDRYYSGLTSIRRTSLHSASKRQSSPAWHRRERAKRSSAKKLLREAKARKLLARHHGSHIMPDVYRFGPKTPNWGCGTCGKDGTWASRTVCRHCGTTAPYRIRAAAKQAHEIEEKKRAKDSSNSSNQQTIAKLEEQLKAAKNENKRLAAKAQQMDSAKELDVVPDAANAEIDAVDLDKLQTLVDLSNKYFPESMHNVALREKLAAERKKKQDAKPVQAQISNLSRRLEKKRKAKAAADQKITDLRKQLECEEASVAVLAVDIDQLGRELQVLQRRAMLTGAETAMCGERVFNLMLESLPKQVDQRPEIAAILNDVRSGMARLFHMANEMSQASTHDISSEAEFDCQEMEDVDDDGYGDGGDSVDFGDMLDKMADVHHIDRDEAVKRLGALLQRQSKRVRIYGKQECKNTAACA